MATASDCKIPIGLGAALDALGVSRAEVLARARLPRGLLDVDGHRVPVPAYFALWQAIRDASGDPAIGIALATSVRPDHTEPLFLAILSAPDVAGALDVVSKYKRLLEPTDLTVRVDDGAGEVVLTYVWPEPGIPQVLLDAETAFIVDVCRRGAGRPELAPRAVHFRAATLEDGAGHAAFFRCPVHLGAAHDAVVFAAEDVARPFVTFNPELLDALLPYLRANTPASPQSVPARIRAVVADRVRGQRPTLGSVGRELAMSGRALQRALQEHGTSFRRLVDDVRNEHARGYLRSTSFSAGEIAFLLGFEEASSFYRAFRAWNGMSPSEFRRRSVAGA